MWVLQIPQNIFCRSSAYLFLLLLAFPLKNQTDKAATSVIFTEKALCSNGGYYIRCPANHKQSAFLSETILESNVLIF